MGVRISLLLPKNKEKSYVQLFQGILQRACKQGDVAHVPAAPEFHGGRDGGVGHLRARRIGHGPLVRKHHGRPLQDAGQSRPLKLRLQDERDSEAVVRCTCDRR